MVFGSLGYCVLFMDRGDKDPAQRGAQCHERPFEVTALPAVQTLRNWEGVTWPQPSQAVPVVSKVGASLRTCPKIDVCCQCVNNCKRK